MDAIKLLEVVIEEMKTLNQPEAPALAVLATMEAAHYKLRNGNLVETKVAIQECSETAESLAGVDPLIPATYFRVSADFDKVNFTFEQLSYIIYICITG